MTERLDSAFPNVFYDLIVFVSPSVVFAFGLAVGFRLLPPAGGLSAVDIGTVDFFVIALGVLLFGYEYGRMAEALSATIVSGLLIQLRKRLNILRDPDFCARLPTEQLSLDVDAAEYRHGSKWAIYFFASLVAPDLGRDLLKRYAWEKLSRSSAFTFGLLLLIALVMGTYSLVTTCEPAESWGFGSVRLTGLLMVLTFAAYYEYYRRNCWNNDLLVKTLPVLLLAKRSSSFLASQE